MFIHCHSSNQSISGDQITDPTQSDGLPPLTPVPDQAVVVTGDSGPTYAEVALSNPSTVSHPGTADRVVYEDPKGYQNPQVC